MKRASLKASCAALMLAAAIGASPAALAQDSDYDAETLQAFAHATAAVYAIADAAQQDLEAASTDEERQQIQVEAQQHLVEAVESAGISVDVYNQIATQAQSDPDLVTEIQSYMTPDE